MDRKLTKPIETNTPLLLRTVSSSLHPSSVCLTARQSVLSLSDCLSECLCSVIVCVFCPLVLPLSACLSACSAIVCLFVRLFCHYLHVRLFCHCFPVCLPVLPLSVYSAIM